jgi:hypothetical protein
MLHQSKMDSSPLKAEHAHVLSPRTRCHGNDGHEGYGIAQNDAVIAFGANGKRGIWIVYASILPRSV